MITVTKEMTFDAGHRLVHYQGPCHNVHGHTYRLRVTMHGALDPKTGFVIDFKDLKTWMSQIIDKFDHGMVLNSDDVLIFTMQKLKMKHYIMPEKLEPTAENMAVLIKEFLQVKCINTPWQVFKVRLWETPTSYVEV